MLAKTKEKIQYWCDLFDAYLMIVYCDLRHIKEDGIIGTFHDVVDIHMTHTDWRNL